MKVLIISGGNIEDSFAAEWVAKQSYDYIIGADSGMDFLYRHHIMPNLIAGDFDSVSREAYAYFSSKNVEIQRLNPIKDDTDTEYVIREAIRRGATEITVLGATGSRLDHALANVYLLGIGLREGIAMELVDSNNRIRMIDRNLRLSKAEQFGSYVSILAVAGEAEGVSLRGFQYPLKNHTLRSFTSLGVSNEITDEVAEIEVKKGILLVIEARD